MKQLEHMKGLPQFKGILALGKQATRRFGVKAAAAAKLLAKAGGSGLKMLIKKAPKSGGKMIPGVGTLVALAFWPSGVCAKGFVNGTANTRHYRD